MKKMVISLLIISILLSLLPMQIFAENTVKFTITPNVTEAHPGDEIIYTVKIGPVQNLAGMKFKLAIPEGLTFVEGKEVEGLQTTLNAAKAEFTPSTLVFVVGSSDYSSNEDTTLMTFKCTVDSETVGEKEVTFIIDNDDIFDTSEDMVNIPVDYSNPGSKVEITPRPIPATGISLNETNITLEIGTNKTLIATLNPTNSTDKITWESNAPEKASVDENGNVTAVSEGNATITAKTESGKVATCNVTVIKPVCKHTSLTTVPAKQPTCTTTGNNEYEICDDCGKVFKMDGTTETTIDAETIEALGHDFSIPCHNETQHWYECSRCGIADTKINHIEEGDYQSDSVNHWKVCGCGTKVDVEKHTAGEPVRENEVSATCIKEGTYDEVVYCSVCNYEMSRTPKNEPAKGHIEAEPVRENEVPATCTEEGSYDEVIYCSICGEEISRTPKTIPAAGHTEGPIVIENEIESTTQKEGSYEEVIYCTKCEKELSRTIKTTPKFVYEILEGDKSSYQKGTDNGITIKTNGKFSKFEGIEVDGKVVDESNYIAKDGSTVLTLKTDYLNTLSIGEHKIKFIYDDGEVETTFIVTQNADAENNEEELTTPKTNDLSNMTLWKIGIAVSGILFVIMLGCKIKGTKRKGRH